MGEEERRGEERRGGSQDRIRIPLHLIPACVPSKSLNRSKYEKM